MATLVLEFAGEEASGELVAWLFPCEHGDPTSHPLRWRDARMAIVSVAASAAGCILAVTRDGRVLASAEIPSDVATTKHAAIALDGAPHFCPRGAIDLHRAPLLSPPELAVVLRQTLRMIGPCAVKACPTDVRSLAWQCLAMVLAQHISALEPPHVVRVLRDLAVQVPELPDARERALAAHLFGMLAWAEHRPRCGRVWLEISETHRDVVLMRARGGAFHVIDTESPALIVPDAALVGGLRATCPGLPAHTYAYARALYTHIVAYGGTTLAHAPSAYVPGVVHTAVPTDAAERARQRRAAALLDGASLDVPRVVFAPQDAPPACNVFWHVFVPPGVVIPAPTPRVHNRLIANLNTSIVHKIIEIMLAVPCAPPAATRDACVALHDTVRLGMASAMRSEFDRLLAEIVELVGQGKNSALGGVHARLAQLALHLRAYV